MCHAFYKCNPSEGDAATSNSVRAGYQAGNYRLINATLRNNDVVCAEAATIVNGIPATGSMPGLFLTLQLV